MPAMARHTDPTYIRRGFSHTFSLTTLSGDRTTADPVISGTLKVFLRGELLYEDTGPMSGGTVSSVMSAADTEGKDGGPILEVWTVITAEGQTDILKDGWLVRYFPSPTLTDQDLLDENPDLLAIAGPSVDKFELFHKRAWSAILRKLFRMGRRAELVLSPSQLWDVEYHETMARISGYFWQTMGDRRWFEERADHRIMAREAWSDMLLQYDLDEDGRPDERWTYPATPLVRTGRASRHGGRPLVHRRG